jgi:hypothetical protein
MSNVWHLGEAPLHFTPVSVHRREASSIRGGRLPVYKTPPVHPPPLGEGPPPQTLRLSVPWLGGNTRRGEVSMSPSARSRSALLGTGAARAAAHNAQLYTWGRGGSNPKAHQPAGWRGARPGYQRPDKQKALRAPRKSRCFCQHPPIIGRACR